MEGGGTSKVPVEVEADSWKDALSIQSDVFWDQVGDLYLEVSLKDLRYSRQVVNFQHLLLIRLDKTLHDRETRESVMVCSGVFMLLMGS